MELLIFNDEKGAAMNEIKLFRADGIGGFRLDEHRTDYTGYYKSKEEAEAALRENTLEIVKEQGKLYALGEYSLLLIFQGMDAAGKDGAIKRVMSGLDPQGTQVWSFKQPSLEEVKHDYLWRISRRLPERGQIGIFNRSYYEEVLVTRVHNLIENERIPQELLDNCWEKRYRQIRDFERYLYENGTVIVKFFLNISKEEQKKRLMSRIDNVSKNWKFSESDIKERRYWNSYLKCYEKAINGTSTDYAPWYVIPADKKWFSWLAISKIILETLKSLDLKYPILKEDQTQLLQKYKKVLQNS